MYVLVKPRKEEEKMTRKQILDLCFDVTCELGLGDKDLYVSIDEIKNDSKHMYYIVLLSLKTGDLYTVLFEAKTVKACYNYLNSLLFMKRKELI